MSTVRAVSRRKGVAASLGLCAGLAGACAFGEVAVTPLAGPAPRSVLVLAPVGRGDELRDLRGLAVGADRALGERGYRAIPVEVGRAILRQCGLENVAEPAASDLRGLAQAADVDAVLAVDITRFELEGDRPLRAATWDLTWRLRATGDGAELWRHREAGGWRRSDDDRREERLGPDGEPATLPFGALAPVGYRDPEDLVLALHRAAMARLPRHPQ